MTLMELLPGSPGLVSHAILGLRERKRHLIESAQVERISILDEWILKTLQFCRQRQAALPSGNPDATPLDSFLRSQILGDRPSALI